MNIWRMNSLMAGTLYLLGTVFGIVSTVIGGDVISSIVQSNLISYVELSNLVVSAGERLLGGAFLILLMGISLTGMTVFLYPIFRKDNKELALGLLLFRGALEGVWYLITALVVILLFVLGKISSEIGPSFTLLPSLVSVVYRFQDLLGPVGTIFFLIGATCLYASFYRTQLIPRWLSVWGFVGVIPYFGYALLHFFQLDHGWGFFLQMVLAPQELVMALWLIIKGFDRKAIDRLAAKRAQ